MVFRFKATLKFYISPYRFKSQRWYFSCWFSKPGETGTSNLGVVSNVWVNITLGSWC